MCSADLGRSIARAEGDDDGTTYFYSSPFLVSAPYSARALGAATPSLNSVVGIDLASDSITHSPQLILFLYTASAFASHVVIEEWHRLYRCCWNRNEKAGTQDSSGAHRKD